MKTYKEIIESKNPSLKLTITQIDEMVKILNKLKKDFKSKRIVGGNNAENFVTKETTNIYYSVKSIEERFKHLFE